MIYDIHGNSISGDAESGYSWKNKKIVFCGDSITEAYGYPEYIGNALGCTVVNQGVSGIGVMVEQPTLSKDFRTRLSNIPNDTDAIVFLADINNIPANDTDYFSTDITRWGGRWNIGLEAVRKSFPTIPVFLVACYIVAGKNNHAFYTAYSFSRMATLYNCIFIDLSSESPVNLRYGYKVWEVRGVAGVHPNMAAVKIFAETIKRRIAQIPPFEFTGTDSITIDSTATVAVGSTAQITYDITGDQSIQWTTSDGSIAQVIGGVVYGKAEGTATITAKTRNNNTATCAVTVTAS